MKIAVFGGSGVFGSRLAEMLSRDGQDIIIIGRNRKTLEPIAKQTGASILVLDRNGSHEPLWVLSPDVIVDAAGPFHAYGNDPYRLVRGAIEHGCHYLDLADDADFAMGISELDADAKAAGVFAMSGASSVPALSAAVVRHFAKNADAIDTISTAILPGNRAPRGYSVIDAVVSQVGTPLEIMIDGKLQRTRSWSDSRIFDLEGGIKRRGFTFGVGDQKMFPDKFSARTVEFRAGLEVGVMAWGLALFSFLRGLLGFGVPDWLKKIFWRGAQSLYPFGTDVGGMSVEVTANQSGEYKQHRWRLVARDGEGLFIPGIAARTIIRNTPNVSSGARPALDGFTLEQAEAAMSDLSVKTDSKSIVPSTVFSRALGNEYSKLPIEIQELHDVYGARRWSGVANVTRGEGWFVRTIAFFFRLPPTKVETPVEVLMTLDGDAEVWRRQFGDVVFKSTLSLGTHGVVEHFGPFAFDLGLTVADQTLKFPVTSGRFFGIKMPNWALPQSVSKEFSQDGKFNFDVRLLAPITRQTVVHYRGWLERDVK